MKRKTIVVAMPGRIRGPMTLAAAAALLVSLGPVVPAFAAEVASGGDKISLTLSGQVNRGVLYVDDGNQTEIMHVDNDNSSTRVRFVGVGRYNEEISAGTVIEVQFESQSTATIDIDDPDAGTDNNFTERKLELYFDHARFGRIWLGQGDTASNGTSEMDLSGTGVIGYSGIADMAGGINFQDAGVAGPQINEAFSNFDGLSRDDRIRYDTPSLSGFQLSASHAESKKSDVAARFSGDVGAGLKVAAAVAYAINADIDSQVNGSISVLHDSGFSVTAAAGQQEPETGTADPFFWYAKLAYTLGGGIGDTSFGIDYTEAEDVDLANDEFTSYGAYVVQNIDNLGTQLYLGVRQHELDRPGSDFDDILAVLGGALIKF